VCRVASPSLRAGARNFYGPSDGVPQQYGNLSPPRYTQILRPQLFRSSSPLLSKRHRRRNDIVWLKLLKLSISAISRLRHLRVRRATSCAGTLRPSSSVVQPVSASTLEATSIRAAFIGRHRNRLSCGCAARTQAGCGNTFELSTTTTHDQRHAKTRVSVPRHSRSATPSINDSSPRILRPQHGVSSNRGYPIHVAPSRIR